VETSLLDQGITLMLVGMGTVFTFLTVLVIGMSLMSIIAAKFTTAAVAGGVTDEEVAVISVAIAQHRKNPTK
jgi:oxaloacetate decarboxylase gamma subunit